MCVESPLSRDGSVSFFCECLTAVSLSLSLSLSRGRARAHACLSQVSLCTPKHRILLKKSKGKGVAEDDSFVVNTAFSSKLKRVRVPLVAMKEAGGGLGGTDLSLIPEAVEEDRRHLAEATIRASNDQLALLRILSMCLRAVGDGSVWASGRSSAFSREPRDTRVHV